MVVLVVVASQTLTYSTRDVSLIFCHSDSPSGQGTRPTRAGVWTGGPWVDRPTLTGMLAKGKAPEWRQFLGVRVSSVYHFPRVIDMWLWKTMPGFLYPKCRNCRWRRVFFFDSVLRFRFSFGNRASFFRWVPSWTSLSYPVEWFSNTPGQLDASLVFSIHLRISIFKIHQLTGKGKT